MAVVFAGGEMHNYPIWQDRFNSEECIICADGGTRHAYALGLVPKLIIGDMDSIDKKLLDYYQKLGTEIQSFPTAKDEVDTELALQAAVQMGYKDIILLGATGGRLDHTLANWHLLLKGMNWGSKIRIIDENHEIFLIAPGFPEEMKGKVGQTISLFPFGGEVKGVNSTGLKWKLKDRTFPPGNPFGVSNVLTQEKATIVVSQGFLLVIKINEEEK